MPLHNGLVFGGSHWVWILSLGELRNPLGVVAESTEIYKHLPEHYC